MKYVLDTFDSMGLSVVLMVIAGWVSQDADWELSAYERSPAFAPSRWSGASLYLCFVYADVVSQSSTLFS